jgi:hypothetical protein
MVPSSLAESLPNTIHRAGEGGVGFVSIGKTPPRTQFPIARSPARGLGELNRRSLLDDREPYSFQQAEFLAGFRVHVFVSFAMMNRG